MPQLALIGIGVYMIGHGVCSLANPGAYGMIIGGICVIVAALT